MLTHPTSDESFDRLYRAGWTVGDVAAITDGGQVWIVTGTNGEKSIEARGTTQDEAWHNAFAASRGGQRGWPRSRLGAGRSLARLQFSCSGRKMDSSHVLR